MQIQQLCRYAPISTFPVSSEQHKRVSEQDREGGRDVKTRIGVGSDFGDSLLSSPVTGDTIVNTRRTYIRYTTKYLSHYLCTVADLVKKTDDGCK